MMLWCSRIGCLPVSRRLMAGLILVAAAVSLMVLVLTPLPSAEDITHSGSPYSSRHLNQENNVYTAAIVMKQETLRSPSKAYNTLKSPILPASYKKNVGVVVIESVFISDHQSKEVQTSRDEAIAGSATVASVTAAYKFEGHNKADIQPKHSLSQENIKLKDARKFKPMVKIFKAWKSGDHLEKAGEISKHGFRLTSKQNSILEKLKPQDRKELEDRASEAETEERKQLIMMHLLDEVSYLDHLRSRNQVKSLPGEGEYVLSNSQLPLRFPNSLKRLHPSKWPKIYGVLKNITHYPWHMDQLCSNYSTVFHPPNSLPTAGLASFPSSGNTWIRYLIESATGIFTGSLYGDNDLIEKGMYGEGVTYDSGMTILQKSHGYTSGPAINSSYLERVHKNHLEELNHSGVIVIRNPFSAIISHRNLDLGVGHTGHAKEADFIGQGWADYVTKQIQLWKEFYIDWLTLCYPKNLHITYYEDMKANPIKEMRAILEFLDIPVDEGRLKCVEQYTNGDFKRKANKDVNSREDPYTQPLKDLIYEAIDAVDEILKDTGHKLLPVEKYEIYDPVEAQRSRLLRIYDEIDSHK